MLEFFCANLSTLLVGAVVVLVLLAVVVKMVRDRKKGKSTCGCSCGDCPSAGICHTKSMSST